jgi:hypothetical protein
VSAYRDLIFGLAPPVFAILLLLPAQLQNSWLEQQSAALCTRIGASIEFAVDIKDFAESAIVTIEFGAFLLSWLITAIVTIAQTWSQSTQVLPMIATLLVGLFFVFWSFWVFITHGGNVASSKMPFPLIPKAGRAFTWTYASIFRAAEFILNGALIGAIVYGFCNGKP